VSAHEAKTAFLLKFLPSTVYGKQKADFVLLKEAKAGFEAKSFLLGTKLSWCFCTGDQRSHAIQTSIF
jgi:hypothetical protein